MVEGDDSREESAARGDLEGRAERARCEDSTDVDHIFVGQVPAVGGDTDKSGPATTHLVDDMGRFGPGSKHGDAVESRRGLGAEQKPAP
jgi:hypothetical protein